MDSNYMIKYSARTFTKEDIELIQWTRAQYPNLSRKELVSTICEFLEWTTDAGAPKKEPCLKFLKKLEAEGILTLPTAVKTDKGSSNKETFIKIQTPQEEITGCLSDYQEIRLVRAKTPEERKRFRSYIETFHRLGYKRTFGSRVFYFITSGDRELGCMQFSASSWALKERDQWIGWTKEDREQRLHLIVNNSRYLIFPWVHIPNLASHALSLAARQIQADYRNAYCYEPVLLETFVDGEQFHGTCYKAANWNYLGRTHGRGRTGKRGDVREKDIYMYPLCKDFRKYLTGEKAYKRRDPDHEYHE
jgi:Domain of unknown function (DUF4338)